MGQLGGSPITGFIKCIAWMIERKLPLATEYFGRMGGADMMVWIRRQGVLVKGRDAEKERVKGRTLPALLRQAISRAVRAG